MVAAGAVAVVVAEAVEAGPVATTLLSAAAVVGRTPAETHFLLRASASTAWRYRVDWVDAHVSSRQHHGVSRGQKGLLMTASKHKYETSIAIALASA